MKKKSLYVDNVILLAKITEEVLKKYEEMKSLFNEASMNVREEFQSRIEKKGSQIQKTFTINWYNKKDIIQLTLRPWIEKKLTKRPIL